ncbi:MAG: hypothetical protein ACLQMT_10325 [Candidatus Acidiferrales bacterium]
MAKFEGARRKLERANQHIRDLENRIGLLEKSHVATVEINPNGGNEVIKHDLSDGEKARTDIAVLVGDAVHNMRCALDHAWWAVRDMLPSESVGDPMRDKFPVTQIVNELEGLLRKRKIDVNCLRLYRRIVDEIQPYKGGNIAIWPVHQADNMDKHRLLIPFIFFSSVEGIELEDKAGHIERGGTFGTMQGFPYYIPIPYGFHVKNKGSVSLSVMFHEEVFDEEFRAVDSLKHFSNSILGAVELLEDV